MHRVLKKPDKDHPIQLSEGDRGLLLALSLRGYRYLTAHLVAQLRDAPVEGIRPRLEALADAGLIRRLYLPDITKPHPGEPIYTLSPQGARLLARLTHLRPNRLYQPIRKSNFLFLEHALRVNEARIAITVALREQPDARLLFWRDERTLRAAWKGMPRLPDKENPGGRFVVLPDAFFGLQFRKSRLFFALEVDRGTMSLPAMERKMEGYLLLRKTGLHQVFFGGPEFRVLLITTTSARKERLEKAREALTQGADLFLIRALPELCGPPPSLSHR